MMACAASAKKVNGPDGEPGWWSIQCKTSQANCQAKAGEVCPHGYTVDDSSGYVGQESSASYQATATSSFGSANGSAQSHTTFRGSMLIKCKNGDASDESGE